MDSGSIGPLPPYCSMNRKKGEMKSANTPSMSKPTFMETQFKQIGDEGQPRLLAARECATEKIQPKVSTGREEREVEDQILEQVDRERIVELARHVADIVSITSE